MRRLLLAAAMAAVLPLTAHALPVIDEVLDPQLFVGPPGSTSPPGGTAIGGESNLLSGNAAGTTMTFGVAGNHTLQSPLLVIFAEPTGASISLTSAACGGACSLAAAGTYGLSGNTGSLGPGNTVYNALGLAAGGSESYTNYIATAPIQSPPLPIPQPAGAPYTLEVFAIPFGLSQGMTVTATEVGAPAGTYVSLYSCETSSLPPGAKCDTNGAIGETPFTNAGLITTGTTSVPEPGAIAILGAGLVGLGLLRRATRRG